jgi:rare lipoprotein A
MVQEGGASWYGLEEKGRPTASGEIMDPEGFTAAHKSLPFGTVVRVDDLDTGRSVVVTINDRGPFIAGRIIDLSYASARALGIVQKGVAPVRIQVMGEEGNAESYKWRVQVGAFREEAHARSLARTLEQQRYRPVLVHRERQGGEILFKVWVGEFSQRAEADRLAGRLRRDGKQAVVLSTRTDP